MICGRIQTKAGDETIYDYSACLYPEGILGYVSELYSLVKTASDSGNDSLFKQESIHIMEEYEISYSNLVDLNSQVTTKYRKD